MAVTIAAGATGCRLTAVLLFAGLRQFLKLFLKLSQVLGGVAHVLFG